VFSIVALALGMAILFVGSRIVIRTPQSTDGIIVDVRTLEELQQEAQRLERENRMLQSEADAAHIRNALSNEGAEERDDPANNSIREEIDRTNQSLRGNRDAWDQGLAEIESMKGEETGKDQKNAGNDSRASGKVQISFSLINPTRYAVDVYNPGYRCEREGEVTVRITVNRGGDVTAAEVDRAVSTADVCMHETAIDAARQSRFDVNSGAPERQTGTITYLFIPQ
jgi:TonB family protein